MRIRSIVIQALDPKQGPREVRILINRPSVGFEDVEDIEEPEAAQILSLSEEDVKEGKPIALRYVRFQAVNSLHVGQPPSIFIRAN